MKKQILMMFITSMMVFTSCKKDELLQTAPENFNSNSSSRLNANLPLNPVNSISSTGDSSFNVTINSSITYCDSINGQLVCTSSGDISIQRIPDDNVPTRIIRYRQTGINWTLLNDFVDNDLPYFNTFTNVPTGVYKIVLKRFVLGNWQAVYQTTFSL